MPTATSPSPISSGWWCPCPLRSRLLRFTRAGTRGLSVRLFRRRAIEALLRRGAGLPFPLRRAAELAADFAGGVDERGGLRRKRAVGPPRGRDHPRRHLRDDAQQL